MKTKDEVESKKPKSKKTARFYLMILMTVLFLAYVLSVLLYDYIRTQPIDLESYELEQIINEN